MGNLFGKKRANTEPAKKAPASQVTDKDRAVLDLKNARDRLKKYRKKLEKDSTTLEAQARELVQKRQKTRALLLLKLRKYKEKELDSVDSQLLSVFKMIEDIEWESSNLEVLKALKIGTEALNKIHEEMSVEDVAALLEETNEAIATENAINDLLAGQLSVLEDEELLDELNSLMDGLEAEGEQEEGHSVIAAAPTSTTIPASAPVTESAMDLTSTLDLPEVPSTPILPLAPTAAPVVKQAASSETRTAIAT